MPRLRLYDVRMSRLPQIVGSCVGDSIGLTSYINSAQQRLILCPEAGDDGWYGTFAEMAFTVSRDSPYLTLPREVARLEAVTICDLPVPVYNPFYEYLDFGNGTLPKRFNQFRNNCLVEGVTRNNYPTFVDLTGTKYLRIYLTNSADLAARIFITGLDANGKDIYNMDGTDRVRGTFYTFEYPYLTTTELYTRITGIQKDQTLGAIEVFEVDPDTGEETQLLRMEPGELTANYRRYYFNNLPRDCCNGQSTTVQDLQLRAICKLEPIPVLTDSDYLVIQNLPAIIEECQAVRYSELDTIPAKNMEAQRHKMAIGYLNGELTHYYGTMKPSVNMSVYGSADLRLQRIGTMI